MKFRFCTDEVLHYKHTVKGTEGRSTCSERYNFPHFPITLIKGILNGKEELGRH